MGNHSRFSGYSTINAKVESLSSIKGTQASQREIEINEFLDALLKEFNSRDVDAIRIHLSEIEKVLGREIEGLDKILFGGSISKNTFIEGTSDVDALVLLNSDLYKNQTPNELQNSFYSMLQKRFPNTEIVKGALAVTVKFSDYEIQLLPAMRENGKVRIANRDNSGWSKLIDSTAFTKRLTKTNKMNNNKVVPVIKLTKNLFSGLPQKYQLSGYHVEVLAVDAFSTYNGRYTLYDMTKHMLDFSTKRVLYPMYDVTGQSGIIDDYLGLKNSISRQQLSHHIKGIANRFSGSDAVSVTKELFIVSGGQL